MTSTSRERARSLIAAWRKNGVRVGEMELDSLALAFEDQRRVNVIYNWLVGFTCGTVTTVVFGLVAWLIWR